MLIVALVLAVIGLAALVTAVVTSNELIAWVCIAASVIGVVLLIVDAVRDRSKGSDDEASAYSDDEDELPAAEDYPEEPAVADYDDNDGTDYDDNGTDYDDNAAEPVDDPGGDDNAQDTTTR